MNNSEIFHSTERFCVFSENLSVENRWLFDVLPSNNQRNFLQNAKLLMKMEGKKNFVSRQNNSKQRQTFRGVH